jgi:hypothetical protein|tara:strand:- start:1031 stop:1414 length:384 start_codon:yes stop_codon:yes gene_type:complete
MSKFMLNDEDVINDVNPFVTHTFSLPGSVRQSGGYDDFTEIKSEPGIPESEKSVYCDYALCAEATSECSLDRSLIPRRNIDTGFTKPRKKTVYEKVTIGVSNNAEFSLIGGSIILIAIVLSLYYARR